MVATFSRVLGPGPILPHPRVAILCTIEVVAARNPAVHKRMRSSTLPPLVLWKLHLIESLFVVFSNFSARVDYYRRMRGGVSLSKNS